MTKPAKTVPGGLLVFFEGIDGVGKTTQLKLAAEALQAVGWDVQTTRVNGGTPIGEALREVWLSALDRPPETDLHIALAMHAALFGQVAAGRAAGKIILVDRGPLSIAGYQMYGDGLDDKLGWTGIKSSMERFAPELVIMYTAGLDTALARARQKPGAADYFESKPAGFFEKVQAGYTEAARRYPVLEIKADASIAAVQEQTMNAIQAAINSKLT